MTIRRVRRSGGAGVLRPPGDIPPLVLGIAASVAALTVLGATPAHAADRIEVEVVVAKISDQPGAIDSRAGRLHRELQKEFRYASLEVLDTRKLSLTADAAGGMKLPNGRQLQIRTILVDERGVLMAVVIEDTLQVDLRAKSGHLVVIGAGRHGDGRLVISLEPQL